MLIRLHLSEIRVESQVCCEVLSHAVFHVQAQVTVRAVGNVGIHVKASTEP